MDSTALVRSLQERVPGARVEAAPTHDRWPVLVVALDGLAGVMAALSSYPEWRFTMLAELTAVDFQPRTPRFEVVYTLVSLELRERLRVKVALEDEAAHVPTMSGIWASANWLEREVWDLFGIVFDEHPDPRRLLMPEDWEGYPLRKDYPVQIRMAARTTEPIQVSEDEFRANLERDRLARR